MSIDTVTMTTNMMDENVNMKVFTVNKSGWQEKLKTIYDDVVEFKIDTAAECSVLTKNAYDKMVRKPKIEPSKIKKYMGIVVR